MHCRRRRRRRRVARSAATVFACVMAALALGAAQSPARTPSSVPTGDWTVVGGAVNAVARAGDGIYLGGRFQGLARRAPGIAAFNPGSGDMTAPAPRLDPVGTSEITVTAVTASPDGGVYVAGAFAGAGGVAQARLLRFGPSGALDTAFRPSVPGASIRDMDVAGGVLYLAGSFTTVGGAPRERGLAAVDADSGDVEGWQPTGTSGAVTQLEASADAVFLAGSFSSLGGQPRANAAAVGTNGAILPWNPNINGTVNALELGLDGSTIYIGGSFTAAGTPGEARAALAAVATAGSGSLRSWNPTLGAIGNPVVNRIALGPAGVYVLGSFTRVGAQPRARLGAIDATSGAPLAWDPKAGTSTLQARPSAIAVHDDRVYVAWNGVAQSLPTVSNEARCGLASVDAVSGAVTPWDPRVAKGTALGCDQVSGHNGGVDLLTAAGGRVWAAGSFNVANVRPRAGLAALNATTGVPLDWAPELAAPPPNGADAVYDLAASVDGTTIYVGGTFNRVNGISRSNAAAVAAAGTANAPADLRPWDPRATGPTPSDPAAGGTVRALALSRAGGLVYLGGDFEKAGVRDGVTPARLARARLAAVDASTGLIAGPQLPSPTGRVYDLLVDPAPAPARERLFIAGAFAAIDVGTGAAPDLRPRAGLAAVGADPTIATPELDAWDARLAGGASPSATASPQVQALAVRDAQLIAGGSFAAPAGPANLAAFALADGALAPWSPAIDEQVETVTIDPGDGTAYITGRFSLVGGESRSGTAAVAVDGTPTGWDPRPGTNFGTDVSPRPPAAGVVLLDAERLLLAGEFQAVGGQPQMGFAFFGTAAAPIGGTRPSIRLPGTETSAKLNDVLTCVAATFTGGPGTLTRAWLRETAGAPATEIGEATGPTYRVAGTDTGKRLSCRETMSNSAGSVALVSDPVTVVREKPQLDFPPQVAGQPWAGGAAQCTTGLWRNAPTSYTYRWFLDGGADPIAGAIGATYAINPELLGRRIACEVNATNEAGAALAPALSATVPITEAPPVASSAPEITGDARVGSRLTCAPGAWERSRAFAYQWLRDQVPLVDEVAPTYVAISRDLAKTLTCLVSAANDGGIATSESAGVVVLASARSTGTGRRINRADDEPTAAGNAAAARTTRIDIRGIRLRAGRTLAITVLTPAAGSIGVDVVRRAGVKASAAQTKKAATKKAATKKKPIRTRPVTLARGLRTVKRAVSATLQLPLSASARRLIARAGRVGLRVTVRASFRAAKGGTVSTDQTSTTLRR